MRASLRQEKLVAVAISRIFFFFFAFFQSGNGIKRHVSKSKTFKFSERIRVLLFKRIDFLIDF